MVPKQGKTLEYIGMQKHYYLREDPILIKLL